MGGWGGGGWEGKVKKQEEAFPSPTTPEDKTKSIAEKKKIRGKNKEREGRSARRKRRRAYVPYHAEAKSSLQKVGMKSPKVVHGPLCKDFRLAQQGLGIREAVTHCCNPPTVSLSMRTPGAPKYKPNGVT